MKDREKMAMKYSEELKRKFQKFPEVRRIARHRHLPKSIYNAKNEHRIVKETQKKK